MTAPDLPAFLLARYSDELRNLDFVRDFIPDEGNQGEYLDPARVLADVEAKREIVDILTDIDGPLAWGHWEGYGSEERWIQDHYPEILKVMARTYSNHPDFDPSWAL